MPFGFTLALLVLVDALACLFLVYALVTGNDSMLVVAAGVAVAGSSALLFIFARTRMAGR